MKNAINEASLLDMLGFITPLPAPFQKRVKEEMCTSYFKRKQLVLKPGEICRRLYFICSGFLRGYFIDENGKECTTWFVGKGELMISSYSFFTQQPSIEYIEVLEDTRVQSLTWHELNSLYADFKEGNLLGRIFTQKYLLLSEQRTLFLRTHKPEHKYDLLIAANPKIELQTTQANIASYLGISRETLSRIKRSKIESSRKQHQIISAVKH
ncbi:Crp/Fnr family transcriptional regulator [Pedobacter sp.]|uniref:Crp/Fnr family transcriptional regulator n=1 Tax=Pedobacter sp. TaxID=1411316 RepID=UPI003C57DEE3